MWLIWLGGAWLPTNCMLAAMLSIQRIRNPHQDLTNTKPPPGLCRGGGKKRNKHTETEMYLGKLHNVSWLLCFLLVKYWKRAVEKSFPYLQFSQCFMKFLMTAFILQVRVWAEALGSILHPISRRSYVFLHSNLPKDASALLMQMCIFSLRFLLVCVLMSSWMNLPEVCLSCAD